MVIFDGKKRKRTLSTVFRNLSLEEAIEIVLDSFNQEKKGIKVERDFLNGLFNVTISEGCVLYSK